MDIGSSIYKFNNKKENEHFLLNKILKEQYLNLDIPLIFLKLKKIIL